MQPLPSAIAALERRIVSADLGAAAWYELGGLKLVANDTEGAIAAYTQCLSHGPPRAEIFNNLGTALLRAGRFTEAVPVLERALALHPGYVRALVNHAKALRELGDIERSMASSRAALAIDPRYIPALMNLADAQAANGDGDAAQRSLQAALAIDPNHVAARTALGIARLDSGQVEGALHDLRAAVSLAPEHAEAHANLAHALFASGGWQAAWPHFEYRFNRQSRTIPLRIPAGMARWDGSLDPNLQLWLVAEQGLGDQLHFARYARLLTDRGMKCTLICDPALVTLLESAGLCAGVVPFGATSSEPNARWFPLMSVPAWHGTAADTVPTPLSYLAFDAERAATWRPRLGERTARGAGLVRQSAYGDGPLRRAVAAARRILAGAAVAEDQLFIAAKRARRGSIGLG